MRAFLEWWFFAVTSPWKAWRWRMKAKRGLPKGISDMKDTK